MLKLHAQGNINLKGANLILWTNKRGMAHYSTSPLMLQQLPNVHELAIVLSSLVKFSVLCLKVSPLSPHAKPCLPLRVLKTYAADAASHLIVPAKKHATKLIKKGNKTEKKA